jgi:hypothetical protein
LASTKTPSKSNIGSEIINNEANKILTNHLYRIKMLGFAKTKRRFDLLFLEEGE